MALEWVVSPNGESYSFFLPEFGQDGAMDWLVPPLPLFFPPVSWAWQG